MQKKIISLLSFKREYGNTISMMHESKILEHFSPYLCLALKLNLAKSLAAFSGAEIGCVVYKSTVECPSLVRTIHEQAINTVWTIPYSLFPHYQRMVLTQILTQFLLNFRSSTIQSTRLYLPHEGKNECKVQQPHHHAFL